MEFENILYVVSEGIATITINRSKAMNSLNTPTILDIGKAVELAAGDASVRGVIVTGAGDKAFVAGADLSELVKKDPVTGREFVLTGQRVLDSLEALPKPVIAAVNGFALGGGCELAMACHMRVVAAHAKFGQPEVGLGIIPGFGGTQRLPRLVGRGRALELLLGGGMIDAAEAYRIGLANCVVSAHKMDKDGKEVTDEKGRKVFDREKFLEEVRRMMKGFIAKAPVATGHIIAAVNRGLDDDIAAGLHVEADLFGLCYATKDAYEGINAFLEKREAKFEGK